MVSKGYISIDEFRKREPNIKPVRSGPHHDALLSVPVGNAIIFEDHGPYHCSGQNAANCGLARQAYRVGKKRGFQVSIRHYPDGRIGVAYYLPDVEIPSDHLQFLTFSL